jgi:acetyl-CoA acetyltransferase
LAMVSVVQREWAAKNPRATFKTPITVEDVLNSRMIAYPFRLLQCCLVTDGGGALILVAAERARDFPQKPVYLLGTGESVETPMVGQMADFTSSRAFRVAGFAREAHRLPRPRSISSSSGAGGAGTAGFLMTNRVPSNLSITPSSASKRSSKVWNSSTFAMHAVAR